MGKRNYTQIQALLPAIKAMLADGKTQRDAAEYDGFRDKQMVKRLLERERRKERKLEAEILPRPKERPRKDAAPRDVTAKQAYEIQRLLCLCPLSGQAGEGRGSCGSDRTATGTQFSHLRLSADAAVAEKAAYFLQPQNCAAGHETAMAEDFFSILKSECIYRHKPPAFTTTSASS